METLLQDLRYSLRMLLKYPAFTITALIALALGISVNSTVFSVVNAVLLRPLPFNNPDSLVWIWDTQPELKEAPVTPADFIDWRNQNQVFEDMGLFAAYSTFNITGDNPEQLRAVLVSANLFSMLGVSPVEGRIFTSEEDKRGNHRVIIISYDLWQRRFNGSPQIIGSPVNLSGRDYNVVGVMPPEFQFPIQSSKFARKTDFWVPIVIDGALAQNRGVHTFSVVARLKPGVSLQEAQTEMSGIASRTEQDHPDTNMGHGVKLVALHDLIVGDTKSVLIILMAAVALVLLIACANVANLLIARAASRQREISIRLAVGASRLRLIRQLLTESIVLALLGGGLGLILAVWGIKVLAAVSPNNAPRLNEVNLDARIVIFTLIVSLITAVLFGLVPALQTTKPDIAVTLKEGERAPSGGRRRHRIRNLIIISEVALTLVLLIGAGLLIRSFVRLLNVDAGFNAGNLLTTDIFLPWSKYQDANTQALFYQQVLDRLNKAPGVEAVGAINSLPLSGDDKTGDFNVEGRTAPAPGQENLVSYRVASPGYFRAMGINMLRGRDFGGQDVLNAPSVVIINEDLARQFWPGEDPIGQYVRVSLGGPVANPQQVVGIIADVHHFGLDKDVKPEVYVPLLQSPDVFTYLVARTSSDPRSAAAILENEIRAVDKDIPLGHVKPMQMVIEESVASRRLSMVLMAIFAGIALILATVGIYGLIAYSVTERTHEIGLRMALGAQQQDILRLLVGQSMRLALIGIVIGIPIAIALTRYISSLLYSVSATDPITFIILSLLLVGVASIASYIPARRAMRINPIDALKHQ
jgi:putative ABC transport system permease protein